LGGKGEPPGYALAQDLKKRSVTEMIRPVIPTEMIRPVIPILPSHAGIMPVNEKS